MVFINVGPKYREASPIPGRCCIILCNSCLNKVCQKEYSINCEFRLRCRFLTGESTNILHFSKAIKSANRRTHNHILSVCSCAWLNSAESFFLENNLAKKWDYLPTFNERNLMRYQSWTFCSARKPCKGKTKGMKKTLLRYLFY